MLFVIILSCFVFCYLLVFLLCLDFNKIRNVFVHSDGILSKSATDTIKVCEKYSQIQLSEYDEDNLIINIDREFCKYSLTKIEKLINEVHIGMQNERASH